MAFAVAAAAPRTGGEGGLDCAPLDADAPLDAGGGDLGFGFVDVEVGVGGDAVDVGGCWMGADVE